MNITEQAHFDELYNRHLRTLKLRGMSDTTIDSYARAVRRVAEHFDCSPEKLSTEQLEVYFAGLVNSHSWSTVKIDRNGLQFFWQYVLKKDWQWIEIIKAPKVQTLPDILSVSEVEHLIAVTYRLRYKVFILATYSIETIQKATTHMDRGGAQGLANLQVFCPSSALQQQLHKYPTIIFLT